MNAPTLLIVGGHDEPVMAMNRKAMPQMRGEVSLQIVPGATHLFEEPGALERVAELAGDWFVGTCGRRCRWPGTTSEGPADATAPT